MTDKMYLEIIYIAQSAGAVEYTDCFSAEGEDPPPNECPGYDSKKSDGGSSNNAGALVQCGVPLIAIASRSHSGPEWLHLIGPYLRVK